MFKQPFKNDKAALSGLQKIQQTLVQQRVLLRTVQSALADDFARHCLHITSTKNSSILYTDSSVWASKLLYMRQTILKSLSQHFGEPVRTLKIRVLSKQIVRTQKSPKKPSSNALKSLSVANNAEASDKLSISMNKLISTLKKNNLSS
ncbi:MAG: hypothetical protein A6F72_05930 [Cycloclasticus sp. symbiont of Poecilosclerida sp. N]|nr:MAG: hypothetical protein A6F72_05930 [Cycloclasticus sp. symbiont of Poecilosclerida sp. N]